MPSSVSTSRCLRKNVITLEAREGPGLFRVSFGRSIQLMTKAFVQGANIFERHAQSQRNCRLAARTEC